MISFFKGNYDEENLAYLAKVIGYVANSIPCDETCDQCTRRIACSDLQRFSRYLNAKLDEKRKESLYD